MHLNWSNFKPEFSGKPEEDAEAHLLCSNDWMEAHHFDAGMRVQRLCLTLLGRQDCGTNLLIRQRYSKLGNTHEQLFHAWRSFTFDENTKTIDSYVIRIRQVTNLLGYGEPHIKNVFELEGVINSRDCKFEFLNSSVPIYPEKELILKPDEQKLVKVRASFVDKISGLAIIKIIDGKTNSTLLIKLKFMHSKAVLDIKNASKDTIILNPKEMIGIVDIRSSGTTR